MLVDARRDDRVRRLHEQGARATGQDDDLPIDPPRDAVRTEEAGRIPDGGAHPNADAAIPRGRRGSLKIARKARPAAAPARKPAMCAVYATPPPSPGAPKPASTWSAAHIPIATMAGTGTTPRKRKTRTRFVGKRTRYAPSTPAIAPDAPSVGMYDPTLTRICATVAISPATT